MLSRIRSVMQNQSGFSLVEVIFAIGILAILAGTAIQAFVVSSNLNKKSSDLDIATAKAVMYLEDFKSSPESYYTPGGPNAFTYYWDKQWREDAQTSATGYLMEIRVTRDEHDVYNMEITVTQNRDQSPIVHLNARKYSASATTGASRYGSGREAAL